MFDSQYQYHCYTVFDYIYIYIYIYYIYIYIYIYTNTIRHTNYSTTDILYTIRYTNSNRSSSSGCGGPARAPDDYGQFSQTQTAVHTARMCLYLYLYIYIYIYLHTHMYTYIYIYIHILIRRQCGQPGVVLLLVISDSANH